MFLSWWRGLVKLADPIAYKSKKPKRVRVPRKFRAAVRLEQLEERVVPFGGQANVFLNLQNATAQLNTLSAARSATVPVYIDFDSVTQGSTGGVGGGTFYVLYDPNVLSLSETATSVGPDVKLGFLLSSMSANYALSPATGFSTGVVAVGLSHSGSTFLGGAPSGHLIELDFHVVQATNIGNTTLLDMQSVFTDVNGNFHQASIHDQGGASYTVVPAPSNYATIGTTGTLTQAGTLSPNTAVNPFSPNDSDTTDAAIQIVAQAPNLAPTAAADTYNMAPNNGNFTPTLTVAGLAKGVLGNDNATANGPMSAVLTGGSATSVTAQSSSISSVTETGLTVTVTTTASVNMQVGEEVSLAGVPLPPQGTYNGAFVVSGVLSPTQFTYQSAFAGMSSSAGGTVTNGTQTLYSAATLHGTVTLNANDGSLAYTPAANYSGTDTFTYQAVDAVSNTPSAPATVTVYVGGYLSIPQNLTTGGIGSQLVVPVNILNPNPANSGGLDDTTIAINYDATVFSVAGVSQGSVPAGAGWNNLAANTNIPGKIIINTGATGGNLPIASTIGGSVAIITFNVIGLPSSGTKSVINLAGTSPQVTSLDVAGTGTPTPLPFAITPVDNTNFNGTPGQTDGLVTLNPIASTTTTVSASVAGSTVSNVSYGTPVTLTGTVVPAFGTNPPSAGSVDFRDGLIDLGTISTDSISGTSAIFTLITSATQLQTIQANGGVHIITAIYTPGSAGFSGSTGTLSGGLKVTAAPLTISALTNTKTYDSTTTASATPTVAGLKGADTVTGLAELYADANAGSSKTLSVSAYTINDGNSGNNYAVTTVSNTTGLINKAALTITARPNTKIFDGTTTSQVTPTVSGLQGADTVTGLTELYSDSVVGTGKTLSVSAYTVSDGNSGNNYSVATVINNGGVINPLPGKSLVSLDVGAGVTAVTAARSSVVKVFIDFDNHTAAGTSLGSNGGLAGGSFYVLYDPSVLSISETAGGVGSDIKLSTLLSGSSSFYNLTTASGFSTGVVAIGLNHSGSTFVNGGLTGHLLELDFHVVQTTSLGISSLLDLQTSFTDSTGSVRTTNIHDKGGLLYNLTPTPTQYAALGTTSTLTQTGVLTPSQFSPADTDSTDASIQIVAGTPALAPTARADQYSMAPNTANFGTTMTSAGLASGVLGNDTATANGPMDAVLTGAGVTSVAVGPQSRSLLTTSETGNVVTVTTSAATGLVVGEGVTITGVSDTDYNGYYAVASVLSSTQFTYISGLTAMPDALGGTVSAVATTVYSAPTAHGQVWLNGLDGSFAYSPTANYLGTDTFTYQAVDARSNTASVNATVTINVGGYLSIPQNLVPVGNLVVVPVNLASGNPANSGGLTNATIGINYDASKLSLPNGPADVTEGSLNTAAGWTNFTVNTNTAGKIVITTSNTGGATPISDSAAGSLAFITFTEIGFPTGTSVVNISSLDPAVTELDVAGTGTSGNSLVLPFAVAPVDNTNFNGAPGVTDGLITYPVPITTTSTVSANVGGSSVATVVYGTLVTLLATVVPASGGFGPVVGSVDFKDGLIDLGTTTTETFSGNTGVFSLVTTANQLQVILANGGVHTITSSYQPGGYFTPSSATLAGGLAVTPASLTITANTNVKTYDATTSAAATPTVAGLAGTDTVTGLAEVYASANVGTSKTLSVSTYTVNDGNGGKDYTVTTVANTTGVINKAALTITATTNTKGYDSLTSAAAAPTVAGLKGGDTVTGLAEVYSNANAGASKTLSVSAFTVNDGNGGNNYAVTTATNTTGVINKAAITITAVTNTKNYDGTTSAAATPSVVGLKGGDTATGVAEVYSDASIGTSKTLSVSAYTVNDGNGGNNYTVATVNNTTGAITVGPTSKYVVSIVGSTTITAGEAFLFTVQATDAFGNAVTSYNGPITLTTTSSPVDLLGNFPLTGPIFSNGFGFFQGTLETAGSYTLTTTGTNGTGTFSGTSAPFTVVAASAQHFTITAPAGATTATPINISVAARDLYGNLVTGYNGIVHLTSTDSAAQLGLDYTFTTSGADPDNGSHTFSVTLNSTGNQTITATDTQSTNPTITGTSAPIAVRGLLVTAFAMTPTGFTASFNRAIVPSDLTLYGSNLTSVQDVVLRGAHVGPIHGTLVVDPSNQSVTFNATTSYLNLLNSVYGGANATILPDDTYTARLISGTGSNGFVDLVGDHLDGLNNAGNANFVTALATTYQHNATPMLGIPDFARGPDSGTPIKVPNESAAGIPVTLSNARNVTDVTFSLTYNPALLNVTGTLSGVSSDATDAAATLTLVSNTGGVATFHYHDSNPLTGTVVLGDLAAVVPSSAANLYQTKELVKLGNVVINNGAIVGALGNGSIHVNAYFGDANADGKLDGVDTLTINAVAVGAASGFDAYQLLDPVIVGDVAGDINVDAGDVSALNLYVAHLNPTQIPVPPGLSVTSPNASDPILSLSTLTANTAGSLTTAPVITVMLDHPRPAGSNGLTEATLALTYDPAQLSITAADITLGTLPSAGQGWKLWTTVDASRGQIGIELFSQTPLTAAQAGSLVNLAFHQTPSQARLGSPWTAVRLVEAVAPDGESFGTELADSHGPMILSPGLDVLVVPVNSPLLSGNNNILADNTKDTEVRPPELVVTATIDASPTGLHIPEATEAAASEPHVVANEVAPHGTAVMVVSGVPASPSSAVVAMGSQVVQIVNAQLASVLPTANNVLHLTDRWFLAMARKADGGDGDDFSGLIGEMAPWLDSMPDAEQTPNSAPLPENEATEPPADSVDNISVLDKLFADLAIAADDLGNGGD